MTPVVALDTFDKKYAALRFIQFKQTTYGSDPNPTFRAEEHPERVAWAGAAATAVGSSNLTRARLLALWTGEGSMAVNSHDRINNSNNISAYNTWPLEFSAAVSFAPGNHDAAKTVYIYNVAYTCLGADFLLKQVPGGADNQPDLRSYSSALSHFKSAAEPNFRHPGGAMPCRVQRDGVDSAVGLAERDVTSRDLRPCLAPRDDATFKLGHEAVVDVTVLDHGLGFPAGGLGCGCRRRRGNRRRLPLRFVEPDLPDNVSDEPLGDVAGTATVKLDVHQHLRELGQRHRLHERRGMRHLPGSGFVFVVGLDGDREVKGREH